MRPEARKFGGMFKKRMNDGGMTDDARAAKYRAEEAAKKSPEPTPKERAAMQDTVDAARKNTAAAKGFEKGVTYPDTKNVTKGIPKYRKGGKVKEAQMEMRHAKAMKKAGLPKTMVREEMAEAKKYAKGGGIESRGKTKGTVIKMASGGSVSARADGCAQRGKTKGRMV